MKRSYRNTLAKLAILAKLLKTLIWRYGNIADCVGKNDDEMAQLSLNFATILSIMPKDLSISPKLEPSVFNNFANIANFANRKNIFSEKIGKQR